MASAIDCQRVYHLQAFHEQVMRCKYEFVDWKVNTAVTKLKANVKCLNFGSIRWYLWWVVRQLDGWITTVPHLLVAIIHLTLKPLKALQKLKTKQRQNKTKQNKTKCNKMKQKQKKPFDIRQTEMNYPIRSDLIRSGQIQILSTPQWFSPVFYFLDKLL